MNEQHYTSQKEHPEDRIFRDKEYINRIQKHIDEVYEKLAKDLRLNDEGKDYLFDYVFNEDDNDLAFEDYLHKLGRSYDGMVDKIASWRKRWPSNFPAKH